MPRNSRPVWLVVMALAAVMACGGCVIIYIPGFSLAKEPLQEVIVEKSPKRFTFDKVLLLDIDGILTGERESAFLPLTENTVASVKEKLERAKQDPRIAAVVLRINSPGGTVTASDSIYNEILEFKKNAKKPVVACLMDVAASGGYYVACAADRIVAHPTGVTGSIGVMMELISIEGLFQKIGVSALAIKSGDKKDMGSPFRKLSAEEQAIFQATIDSMYGRFLDVVAEGRPKLGRDQIRKLADGRIYTAPDAVSKGLVDKVGQLSDAIELAKQGANVTKAHVIMYTRPMATGQSGNIYTTKTPNGTTNINLINVNFDEFRYRHGPVFMYLWSPGT